MVLARDMVSRTRLSKLLSGYRNRPKADSDAICRALIQVAQLVIDVPEIAYDTPFTTTRCADFQCQSMHRSRLNRPPFIVETGLDLW
jgi:hypothetical protein